VGEILQRIREGEGNKELEEAGEALEERIRADLERLFTGPPCQGICGGNPVAAPIRQPLRRLGTSLDAPSPTDLLSMEQANEALIQVISEVNALFAGDLAAFRTLLEDAGFAPFPVKAPLEGGMGTFDG
jgi:hypothetical protein